MAQSARIPIEITGRDEFWARAFHVEWEDQFPERKLRRGASGSFLAEPDWVPDLERVAAQCYCTIMLAPANPRRRRWFKSLLSGQR
jgi:hypothetical protein